jgi:hypothetical protein
MSTRIGALLIFSAGIAAPFALQAADPAPLRVVSDRSVSGFVFPESVGCDPAEKVLYVSQFGGTELKPGDKDGNGFISKVALDGKVLEQRAFDVKLDKPKGIWIEGSRLWVTDIDAVWVFDTKTKKGRRLELPGIKFANDVAVQKGAVYVSDNRSDQLFRVEPADFLDAKVTPKVTVPMSGKSVFPNGIWPAKDGSLLMVGFQSAEQKRGIYAFKDGEVKTLSDMIGRLDGLFELADGTILATDWNTGSVFHWSKTAGVAPLAPGFKGPADFCVIGDTAYVPDLPQGQVRIIQFKR